MSTHCRGALCPTCAALVVAVIPAVAEHGINRVRRSDVAARAGVCADGHADLDELIQRAYRASSEALQASFVSDFLEGRDWREGLELAIDGMLATLAADVPRMRFLFVDVLDAPRFRRAYLAVRRCSARRWADMYSARNPGYWPRLAHFELLSGAVAHAVAGVARSGRTAELAAIRDPLIAIALTPSPAER